VVVDTHGLGEGQHYILVHGKNINGFWGPFTAVFFSIFDAPPTAEFTTKSAIELDHAVQFINKTIGTVPLTYAWNFGDGSGTSTEINPVYTYSDIGAYIVILEATNLFGTDSITHTVSVEPVITKIFLPLTTK
jgi:PKD repeat protein